MRAAKGYLVGSARLGLGLGLGAALFLAGTGHVARAETEHCGEVSSNQTWRANDAHIVTCDVVVRNSTLTLEPGVQINMNAGTNLIIEPGAGLVAPGNPQARQTVLILPNDRNLTPGFWGQILVKAGATESLLNDVRVAGGGAGGKAMIELHSPVPMNLMTLQSAAGLPIALAANVVGPSLPGSTTVRCENGPHPAFILSRNGSDAVGVLTGQDPALGDVVDAQAWFTMCAPYVVEGTLKVGSPFTPTLSLQPGVTVRFGPNGGLVAGLDPENMGQFETSGDPDPIRQVRLTGMTEAPGSWAGIDLSPYVDPVGLGHGFINTRIEYGGAGGQPMVRVRTNAISVIDTVFAHAQAYPIEIPPDAVDGLVQSLGGGSTEMFVGNGVQRILVLADAAETDLPRSATWYDPGVPFEIDGDLLVAGAPAAPRFVLEAGVTLAFREGKALFVGHETRGLAQIETRGLDRRPVTFTSLDSRPGAWRGLRLSEATLQAQLAHLVLENGGAGGEPMLEWGAVAGGGSLSGSTLREASGYPLAIAFTRFESVLGEAQIDLPNRFEANGVNRILVRVDGPYAEARPSVWADPGVPIEFDESAVIARPAGTSLTWQGALDLRFPAGRWLQIGATGERATVKVVRVGNEPVALGPMDPVAGWAGLQVVGGGTFEGEFVRISGAADDAANLTVDGGVVALEDLLLEGGGRATGALSRGIGAELRLEGARVLGHRVGLQSLSQGRITIARSTVAGNGEWGFLSGDPSLCHLASLVYWGAPGGPTDRAEADDCLGGVWEGGGDRVSEGVMWWPYALDEQYTPASGLGPNPSRLFLPAAYRGASPR